MRFFLRAAILSVAATSAFAEPGFQPGLYAAVDIGRASISSKYADNSGEVTAGGALGYQYTPNFGVEVYSRGLSLNPFQGAFAEAGYYPDTHYGIAVLGTTHLDDHFRLFGRAGIGRTTMRANRSAMEDRNQTDAVFGAGVGYAFNRSWSLNLEGSYFTKSEVSLLTLGARYQF